MKYEFVPEDSSLNHTAVSQLYNIPFKSGVAKRDWDKVKETIEQAWNNDGIIIIIIIIIIIFVDYLKNNIKSKCGKFEYLHFWARNETNIKNI